MRCWSAPGTSGGHCGVRHCMGVLLIVACGTCCSAEPALPPVLCGFRLVVELGSFRTLEAWKSFSHLTLCSSASVLSWIFSADQGAAASSDWASLAGFLWARRRTVRRCYADPLSDDQATFKPVALRLAVVVITCCIRTLRSLVCDHWYLLVVVPMLVLCWCCCAYCNGIHNVY